MGVGAVGVGAVGDAVSGVRGVGRSRHGNWP